MSKRLQFTFTNGRYCRFFITCTNYDGSTVFHYSKTAKESDITDIPITDETNLTVNLNRINTIFYITVESGDLSKIEVVENGITDCSTLEQDGKLYFRTEGIYFIVTATTTGLGRALITSTESPQVNTADVVQNLANCTSDAPTSVKEGSTYTIGFTPNENYQFNTQPTLTYMDSNGSSHTLTATDSSLTFTIDNLKDGSTINIVAVADAIPQIEEHNVNNNTVNCSAVNQTSFPETLNEEDEWYIDIEPNDNLSFTTEPYATYINANGVLRTIKATSTIYKYYELKLSFTDGLQAGSEINVYGVAGVNSANISYEDVVNATVSPTPASITKNDTVVFTFTADEGYYFNTAIVCTWVDVENETRTINVTDFTDERTKATLTLEKINVKNGSEVKINAVAIEITEGVKYINIFSPTETQMNELANKRFYKLTSISSSDVSGSIVDLSQYITSFKKCFFDFTPNGARNIVLGWYNTTIVSKVIKSNLIEIDCGNVTVQGLYDNSLDFSDTELTAILTFIGEVSLQVSKYMNKKISLKYRLNVIDCSVQAIFYDTDTNAIIDIFNGVSGFNIPYFLTTSGIEMPQQLAVGNFKGSNINAMFSEKPYLLIRSKKPIEDFAVNGLTSTKNVNIKDCTGFNRFDIIEVTSENAEYAELIEIENILKSGIVI